MHVQSIGIDVSKDKLDICLLIDEQKTKHLQLSNNAQDIPNLVKVLELYQGKEDTPVVIEATGGYHYGITFFLLEKGFNKVFVINPLITKKYLKNSVRKTKTDKTDALLLARIALFEKLHCYAENKEELLLKKKVRLYHFFKRQLQQVNNKLSSSKSIILIDEFEMDMLSQTKQELKAKIEKIKKEIVKIVKVNFSKIRGVSDFNLKAITAELGNIKRFGNHKQVIAFAGMDPSIRESGTSVRGRGHLSKRGSKSLRFLLFQSAWGVMMHNEKYQNYFRKKKSEGKHYFSCLTAIARKLLCEIYSNLKTHSYSIS